MSRVARGRFPTRVAYQSSLDGGDSCAHIYHIMRIGPLRGSIGLAPHFCRLPLTTDSSRRPIPNQAVTAICLCKDFPAEQKLPV